VDIDSLRIFLEVARRGSFAAVARDHGAEPSSISRIIGGLEKELAFRLFQRSTRRTSLTESGAIYLQQVEAALNEFDRARDLAAAVQLGPAGTLRLTASIAFGTTCLVPLLPPFRATYPAVEIELLLSDTNLDLVADRIDLAIRLAPSVQADVIATKLMDTRYHVCATPGYLSAHGRPDSPDALGAHSCVLFTLPGYRTRWLFRDAASIVKEIPVHGTIAASNALAVRAATLEGLGPALLPDWLIAGDLANGTLIDLFPIHRVAATDFATAAWLLYPSRAFLPAKVRAMIDFLRERMVR
jgi:DNA-binding transcriptional LysR family regulator